jgi:diguanylate cyclase (GGDEF)-like protein/PAS domain S-box-containing protein
MNFVSLLKTLPASSKGVLVLGVVLLVSGGAGATLADDTDWINFFDNLHWSAAFFSAAILAWQGYLSSTAHRPAHKWLAIGLTGYAIGQLCWDIQFATAYDDFPAPSDLFYLWLGPCFAYATLRLLFSLTPPPQRVPIFLDASALTLAVIIFVLVIYLPERGDTELLSLTILIIYPVTLFSACCIAVITTAKLRLRLSWQWLTLLLSLILTGLSWMEWNFLALDGITVPGSWLNLAFSIAGFGLGVGALSWQAEQSGDAKYDRRCEGFLRLLPLLNVLLACLAIVLANGLPGIPESVEIIVNLVAPIVIILAMFRQGLLLAERDQLIESQKARNLAEDALKDSEQRWRFALESAGEGVWDWNIPTSEVIFTKQWKEMLGHTDEEIGSGLHVWSERVHPEDLPRSLADLHAYLDGKTETFSNEHRLLCKDGSYKWILTRGMVTNRSAEGKPVRVIGTHTDITTRKLTEDTIQRQANYDPLTQLPNRRLFRDRLELEIRKAHRNDQLMALMFIDLDNFKEVNDTLGHDMGDILLIEAAQRINTCVRETDTVARLGGDEFVVILAALEDVSSVERVAQDILNKLTASFQLEAEKAFVSASIGITLYPSDATEIEELLKHADQAMYASKRQGRNRFSYFTPSMQRAVQTRMRLASDLRGALAGDQFRVYYQPIVTLSNGAITKAEALIRWQHPTQGLINPAEFIPIAEETGLIIEIGDWVFRQAARQALRWRAKHHPKFQISVNVSPVQLQNGGITTNGAWLDHLQKIHLPGQGIVVEITEGMLLDIDGMVTDQLLAFRDAGIRVSLDDFGTGYSSLSYLKKLDIDYLKIDQSFVRNLEPNSDDMALCEAIIAMAHKLGLKVVAEGVETEGQRGLLATAGCNYAQGYLFSKPVTVEEFEQLLEHKANNKQAFVDNYSI